MSEQGIRSGWESLYRGRAEDCSPPDPNVIRRVSVFPPGRALDIGCGAGGLVIALCEMGWTATGIDITESGVASARAAAVARNVEATFITADASTWRPDRPYDLVTCNFGLPPEPDVRRAVYRTIREALAPGGVALLHFCEGNISGCPAVAGYGSLNLEEAANAFRGLELAAPEYVQIPAHRRVRGRAQGAREIHGDFHVSTHSSSTWTAVFFEARQRGASGSVPSGTDSVRDR
jgi:SAM-dependent methyltransferase